MIWALIILSIILFLLFTIIFSNLKIVIDYYHGNDNDDLKINIIGLWGLFRYKLTVPVIEMSKDSPELIIKKKTEKGMAEKDTATDTKGYTAEDMIKGIKDIKTLIEHVSGLYKVVRNFLKKVSVDYLEWRSKLGTGDAAYTGMAAGALWTAKGSLVGFISSFMRLKKMPVLTVTPDFQAAVAETSIKCMFRFRIGNAIFAVINLYKLWKGGKAYFRTKPLSIFSKEKTKTV